MERSGKKLSGILFLMILLLLVPSVMVLVTPDVAFAESEASLILSGWGWCPAYGTIANVTLTLQGVTQPRAGAPEIADLNLSGILKFEVPGKVDRFDLELRGTRTRSVFYLRQVTEGTKHTIVEIEGFWLAETDYVACQGRLLVPLDSRLGKPYGFVLRTGGVEVPDREPGSFVENIDFIIQRGVLTFDIIGDRLAESGQAIRDLMGAVLTQLTVLAREVRRLGIPYIS